MSRSIDLFIQSSLPVDELAGEVARLTGLSVVATADEDRWELRDGEVHAELAEHNFVDDGDLLFSRYRYSLSAHVPLGGHPGDTPEATTLRVVAKALHAEGSFPVLLVLDLQYRDAPATGEGVGSGR